MARDESDREDLLREATALVERIALAPTEPPDSEHVVIGFRAGGEASIFFGAEPAYHFNSANELRRAYANGLLFKADRGQLVSMERVRTESVVELRRHDLTTEEQSQFVADLLRRLQGLGDCIERQQFFVVGQVPAKADVLDRVRQWLRGQWLSDRHEIAVARSPHVGRS